MAKRVPHGTTLPYYTSGRCPCGKRKGCTNTGGRRRICGCKSRTNATGRCHQFRLYSNGRCRFHGGRARAGVDHPNFKHGKFSNNLPTNLAARYEEFRRDPGLVQLVDELALLDARVDQILGGIDGSVASEQWRAALDLLETAKKTKDDVASVRAALGELEELLRRGVTEASAWDQILRLWEQRRRMVATESRRRRDMHEMLTLQHGMTLVAALTAAVIKHVTDPRALSAIQAEFTVLTGRTETPALPAGRG